MRYSEMISHDASWGGVAIQAMYSNYTPQQLYHSSEIASISLPSILYFLLLISLCGATLRYDGGGKNKFSNSSSSTVQQQYDSVREGGC